MPAEGAKIQEAESRARVDAFVARHFSIRGTLRLHRHALGLDLLRAPPTWPWPRSFSRPRLFAILLSLIGLRRVGRWLGSRRILFRSAVARAVEGALIAELIPKERAEKGRDLIEDYTAVRSAVSEIFTTALVLILGYAVFRIATPGVISLAPVLTEHAARSVALAEFPLGAASVGSGMVCSRSSFPSGT